MSGGRLTLEKPVAAWKPWQWTLPRPVKGQLSQLPGSCLYWLWKERCFITFLLWRHYSGLFLSLHSLLPLFVFPKNWFLSHTSLSIVPVGVDKAVLFLPLLWVWVPAWIMVCNLTTSSCYSLWPSMWILHVHPKYLYPCKKLHGVTTQSAQIPLSPWICIVDSHLSICRLGRGRSITL